MSDCTEIAPSAKQAEASEELDVKEGARIKGHFDRVRDALESTSDPECSRFMRRTKIEQALVSIDQLVLDWRDNRLSARPAPTAEKALREVYSDQRATGKAPCEKCAHADKAIGIMSRPCFDCVGRVGFPAFKARAALATPESKESQS